MVVTAAEQPLGGQAEPRWLTPEEGEAWLGALTLVLQLPGALEGQLQDDAGISLFEYLALSFLSMEPERTTRMSELARLTNGSLSRLSNVTKRLEARDLVTRRPDPADGRYTVATLTDAGYELVVRAAPGHVAAVRRHLVDPLTPAQLRALSDVGAAVREHLDDCPAPPSAGADGSC